MKLASIFFICFLLNSVQAQKLNVVVVGLNHDHVHGILREFNKGQVNIIGIVETNDHLREKYAKLYNLPPSIFYSDLKTLVLESTPDAVLGYNSADKHLQIVEICAPLKIPVMVEKPLAATLKQAILIQLWANKYQSKVLTNYETTWYPSYKQINDLIRMDSIGAIKKMVAHDGHQGPIEIGCSPEFLNWLTDSIQNGAGALNDFGCYGADLMTWLMHGQRPIAVTAITRHYKPALYPKVDDDATIIVEYENATGQIEASWNWPFSIKDLEVFGDHGYYHAFDNMNISSRMRENRKEIINPHPLAANIKDPLSYLKAVLKNEITGDNDQSSLKYNVIVMEILDAAKRSASSGKRILLPVF
jgi:predicted dehydrogenase